MDASINQQKIQNITPKRILSGYTGAIFAALTLICVAIAALYISDYRKMFHTDTYVHALLLPKIMLTEGKILLDNFPYSNGDNRTIAIALVHLIPTAIFPDNPWMSYFLGSVFLSAIFLIVIARSGMKLNAPLLIIAPLMLYVSISPSWDFYEHIHGQNSYILEQTIMLVVLTAVTLYLSRTEKNAETISTTKLLSWSMLPALICLVIVGATGINRTLVTIYAPLTFAFIGCRILMLVEGKGFKSESIKRDLKFLGILVFAMIAGAIVFKLIAGQIYYTRGAAKPLNFANWRGQWDTLKHMYYAFQRLTYWGLPSTSLLTFLRNLAGIAIVLYVAIRSIVAILRRNSPAQIMIVLYMLGLLVTLALAFNLTDIRPEARYMLPFMTAVLFAVIVFSVQARLWEKYVIGLCITVLAVSAFSSAHDRRTHSFISQTLHEQIHDVFAQNSIETGITYMGAAGMLNLGMGVGNFIPVKLNKDGNVSTLPFHTDFYYRDYEPAEKTGFAYVTSRAFASASNEVLDQFLSNHEYPLIHEETIVSGRDRVRVMVVEGDLRNIFPGSAHAKKPTKRLVSENSRFKVGSAERGEACSIHINVRNDEKGFSTAETAFMISPGSYSFEPLFDNDHPDLDTLTISLSTDSEKEIFKGRWKGVPFSFDVRQMGMLRILVMGRNASGFEYCGNEIQKISDAK